MQKHKLPKTALFQIGFMSFHSFFSFQPKTGNKFNPRQPRPVKRTFEQYIKAMLMPLRNQRPFGRVLELTVGREALKGPRREGFSYIS